MAAWMVSLAWLPGELPWLVANGLGILLAITLLIRDSRSAPVVNFAGYLFFRSAADLAVSLGLMAIAADSIDAVAFQRARLYFFAAQFMALVAFAAHYIAPAGVFASRPARLSYVAATGILWALIAWVPGFVETVAFDFGAAAGQEQAYQALGPGIAVFPLLQASEALLALWLMRDALQRTGTAPGRVMLLLATGFAAMIGHHMLQLVAALMAPTELAIIWPVLLVGGLPSLVALFILGVMVLRARSRGLVSRNYTGALAAAMVLPFVAAFFGLGWVGGLAWLALPLLATWALLRYSLFDVDLRVKWTIKAGTVASVFLAVYSVVALGASELILDELGYVFGAMAAGLLFLAFRPLQAFAERLASQAVPDAKPVHELANRERLDLYRDQVELAWQDGTIGIKERSILSNLRDRLSIDLADAARIEDQVTAT